MTAALTSSNCVKTSNVFFTLHYILGLHWSPNSNLYHSHWSLHPMLY